MIKLYLANLGKYNEGILKGAWIELPYTQEELEEKFVEIGIAHYDAEGNYVPYVVETDEKGYEYMYEEYAIHDYETDLDIPINEYSSLDNLNAIAENVDENDVDHINLLLEEGDIGLRDLIEYTSRMILQDYSFIELNSNISNEDEKVGYGYIDEVVCGVENLPREVLERYFDFEAYGRDLRLSGDCYVDGDIMVLN